MFVLGKSFKPNALFGFIHKLQRKRSIVNTSLNSQIVDQGESDETLTVTQQNIPLLGIHLSNTCFESREAFVEKIK